jgi:hypothetical protein
MTSFDENGDFQQRNNILGIEMELHNNNEKQRRFKKMATCPKVSET